jgi:hypothetical protein
MLSKVLTRIGIGIGGATVLVVFVGFLLPSTFEVTRTVVIKAGPEHIHEFTGDLARWSEWTPWLKDDPNLVVTMGDKTTGVGAGQTWRSGSNDGHLAFTRCDPAWGIAYDMAFDRNTYESTGSLQYRPVDGGTEVVWTMTGDNGMNILARYFGFLMPSMIGPMFEEGLTRLNSVSSRLENLIYQFPPTCSLLLTAERNTLSLGRILLSNSISQESETDGEQGSPRAFAASPDRKRRVA